MPQEYEGLKLNTDFRSSILFELLMQDTTIEPKIKIGLALQLYYETIPQDTNKALKGILWFYTCGKNQDTGGGKVCKKEKKQIYSFDYDDKYIYSAFMEQYGIDLTETNMHWWKFRAMFNGLNEDTLFSKIMGYRSIDISSIKDKQQKDYYKKMKNMYRLPDNRSQEQKESDFANALW